MEKAKIIVQHVGEVEVEIPEPFQEHADLYLNMLTLYIAQTCKLLRPKHADCFNPILEPISGS